MAGIYSEVAAAARTLPVTVIINPGNGDQAGPCPPNGDWAAVIALFGAHPNVSTLGYVHSSYGKRPLAECTDLVMLVRWTLTHARARTQPPARPPAHTHIHKFHLDFINLYSAVILHNASTLINKSETFKIVLVSRILFCNISQLEAFYHRNCTFFG